MPLDHYVTLGPLRPPRQPAVPRRDDVRRRPRLGLHRRGVAARSSIATSRSAATSSTPRTSTPRATRRRSSATTSAATPAKRDRLVIATKFSGNLYPGDPNGGGSGRKSIVAACENSLRRLQTDYIDLYWLHNWDVHTPIEETMAALDDLVRAGQGSLPRRLRHAGVEGRGGQRDWRGSAAGRRSSGCRSSIRCSSARVEQELVPMARELGLGITPWSPLKSGVLSGQIHAQERGPGEGRPRHLHVDSPQREDVRGSSTSCEAIAKAHDSTVARVALAWVRAQPGVTSTIIGARRAHAARGQLEVARRHADERGAPQARRADEADVRVPPEHAAACSPPSTTAGPR